MQLEEYKICMEKVDKLEGYIWKTASIFGIGSFVGMFTLFQGENNIPPYSRIVIGFLAIALLLLWLRYARRWWSIQEIFILRMIHLEEKIGFRPNIYVKYRDAINMGDGNEINKWQPEIGNEQILKV